MKNKKTKLGQALLASAQDAVAYERGEKALRTSRREIARPAPEFSKTEIKKIRENTLKLTQVEFAQLLNVDVSTIQHWEQGLRRPRNSANRLLEVLLMQPNIVRNLLIA